MKPYDRVSSVIFLVIGLVVVWQSAVIPMGNISKPGPGYLPFWVGIILVFLSTFLWFEAGRQESSPARIPFLSGEGQWRDVGVTAGLLAGFTFTIEFLGFVISTLLFLFFLFRFVGKQKWGVVLAGTILVTFSVYLIFKVSLKVQLPPGLLTL